MDWLRRYWIHLVVMAAFVGSILINSNLSGKQAKLVRTAAIVDCIRSSARAALVTNFKEEAARAARQRGEFKIAIKYEAAARGGRLLIPVPSGRERDRDVLATVDTIKDVRGRPTYVVTDAAHEMIEEGCRQSYEVKKPTQISGAG